MLWTYALKEFSEQLNLLKGDDDGINPMEKFAGTTIDITLKNNHTRGCIVYALDEIFQRHIDVPPKWEPRSRSGIYLGHSPFHAGSVALVLNPATVYVSPQCHVVFDDKFTQLHA